MTPVRFASAAMIRNPRLAVFAPLVGEWTTAGHHTMLPGVVLRGRTVFDWHEGGAFLRMRSEVEEPRIPTAIALVEVEHGERLARIVAADERGVSRRFEVAMDGATIA